MTVEEIMSDTEYSNVQYKIAVLSTEQNTLL